jgi:hypothetical protein
VQFFQEWTNRKALKLLLPALNSVLGSARSMPQIIRANLIAAFLLGEDRHSGYVSLAPETLFLLRADVQLSPDELVPLEQFGLGGIESVRGYRQDALLTDNGALCLRRVAVADLPSTTAAIGCTADPIY